MSDDRRMPTFHFLVVVFIVWISFLVFIQAYAAASHKVVHVDGRTCIETRGFARSISCDWSKP